MSTEAPSVLQSARFEAAGVVSGAIIDSRYEVLRPVARGKACEVFEVRHLHTGRAVALKLLRHDHPDKAAGSARIAREASALGAVQHPAVVGILDSGCCRHVGPFVVLDKLDGRSLDGLLAARGYLEVAAVVAMMRTLTMALAEVHRQGFVHRAIHPSNVFIASSRVSGETIQLLDFGSVGDLTSRSGKSLTPIEDVDSMNDFLAPEQIADPYLADPRADLYSLAMVVAVALGAGHEQLFQARNERLRAHTVLAHKSDIPAHVIDLLDDMLAPSMVDRPWSGEAVLERLGKADRASGSPLLAYKSAAPDEDRPTLCEPASRRAKVSGRESRRHLRAPYITPARIVGNAKRVDGRTEDISASGLLVVVRGEVSLEGSVTVRFALPTTGRVVAVEALLKWQRQHSGLTAVGLEFVGVDRSTADAIETYAQYVAVER